MGMNISWITDAVVGQSPVVPPETPAIALGNGDPISYGQLRERELTFARALMAHGVRKGDRVALLLRNSTDYVAWFLACGRVGAICVRTNWRLTGPELVFQAQDSRPSVYVFDPDFADAVADVQRDAQVSHFVVNADPGSVAWAGTVDEFTRQQSDEPFPEVDLNDPLTLMYTSGTTGAPKGVLLTHGNTFWIGATQRISWGFDASTVGLNMGPLFHAGGFEVVSLPTLMSHGLLITYPSGGFTLEGLLQTARHHKATIALAYAFLLYEFAASEEIEGLVPPSLRRIISGGDSIMPWVYRVFEERIPHVNLTQSYSLTEGGAIAVHLDHAIAHGRESSVGVPQPFTQIRVVGEDGRDTGVGEVGEIWLRSPCVSTGYWERPEANTETFIDGWCRSGDLGFVNDEGYLTLAGRAKDMIRSGGENIYPVEIEKLISELDAVHDVAVFGVPHERYVEVGCALVVPEPGATIEADEVLAHLKGRLATFKIPKHVIFADALPRNASGKVLKTQLRGEYTHLGTPTGTIRNNSAR